MFFFSPSKVAYKKMIVQAPSELFTSGCIFSCNHKNKNSQMCSMSVKNIGFTIFAPKTVGDKNPKGKFVLTDVTSTCLKAKTEYRDVLQWLSCQGGINYVS